MAKNIEPTLKLISEYLKVNKNENFVIPEYQRGYSWDIAQCDKLWQDIDGFMNSEAKDPYFFGTIIIDCSESNKFSLIDGQQRTTTFILLLKAMLLRINLAIDLFPTEQNESLPLKEGLLYRRINTMEILYKAEPDEITSFLNSHDNVKGVLLLENKSINELYRDEIQTILEAKDFQECLTSVYTIPRKKQDNKYTNHFRNFKYFYNKLGEKSESQLYQFANTFLKKCQVIEIRSWQVEQAITMFNSLNSTGVPLSDADIISAKLYSNSGEYKDIFNDKWESIHKLSNNLSQRKIVNIDSILQQYMYINRAIGKEYVSNNLGSIDVTTPGLRRYYIEVKKELLQEPLAFCDAILKIANIWNTVKDFPIVKLMLKFNENAKIYLASFLNRYDPSEITEEKLKVVCECLLRLFTVLELGDAGYSSAKFKTFLFGINLKLIDKNVSIDTIKQEFSEHINKNWDKAVIASSVIEYEKNLLVYLNEYLFAVSNKTPFDFYDNVNIEHIMPASGRNLVSIQRNAQLNSKDEFELFANKLGNKILLEDDINRSIGNDWFKTKKQNSVLSKTGYKDSMFGLALRLTNYPKDCWTKDDIDSATLEATERICDFIFEG